ncbi:MAG: hypothetical protein ACHQ50_11085 [Fimbriimonadales bacterium]
MRKLTVILFAIAGVFGPITPVPLFSTTPADIEKYDALPAGSKPSIPMFAGTGSASRIGAGGALIIGGFGSPKSPPNMMFGRGVDVRIRIKPPMTFFGGSFKVAPAGVKVTKVTFKFYSATSVLIGTVTNPLTNVWTWIGYRTDPKWARVDVLGNGTLKGYVAFDDTRVK